MPSFAEVHATLRDADLDGLPGLGFAVLRNVTIEPIVPYLRYGAYKAGLNAAVELGAYDGVLQEALDPNAAVWKGAPRVVLVFAKLETLSPALALRFPTLPAPEIEAEVARIGQFVASVLAGLAERGASLVLWHGFETPVEPALGIYDSQSQVGQLAVVRRLNAELRAALAKARNAYFVDLDLCLARVGAERFYDRRYWHIGRAPWSREGLRAIAEEDLKFVRASLGKTKKCLALDCDNVLWGGIVGEDGVSGIALAQEHPGSPYYELQQEILSLHRRGVILALCSKNNEADVWQVFREHPEMVLREEHIAAHRINWQDKATNLRELAAELNIGLDHIVFVDDSDFEAELVRKTLPEVEVIHLPPAKAAESRHVLASCGWFDSLVISEEDRRRGEMYRAESQRRQAEAAHPDLASYLRTLEMTVEIADADENSIPRLAQLSQRTNQFNLTTLRYSEQDVRALAASPDADVLSLRLRDRFGDHGLIGLAVLRHAGGESTIEAFLMSCRVIGRGVEDAFVRSALERAIARGSRAVNADYRRTAKNGLVADFYPRVGFALREADGDRTAYTYPLAGELPKVPDYLIVSVAPRGGSA